MAKGGQVGHLCMYVCASVRLWPLSLAGLFCSFSFSSASVASIAFSSSSFLTSFCLRPSYLPRPGSGVRSLL